MVRHVQDPWKKKSKKGMKTLGKMAKVGGAIGAAAYSEIKRNNVKTQQTDFSSIPASGWVVFFIGVVIGVVVMTSMDNSFLGFLYFFGILFLTVIATVIVSIVFPDNKKASEPAHFVSTTTAQPINTSYSPEKSVLINSMIIQMKPIEDIDRLLQQLQSYEEQRNTVIHALEMTYNQLVTQTEISPDMENYIDSIMRKYSYDEDEAAQTKSYIEYMKALIVQDLLKGITPTRVTLGSCPINMQPGETPIWPFMNVVYYEEVTKRSMVGASTGISVRIAKGVYYKVGAFKGEPLITTSLQPKYGGALILTNKNIYFYSTEKSMKFPYNKIISYVPFEDAIGIQQDKANAKTVYFKCLDGRFAFNIVSNINNIQA